MQNREEVSHLAHNQENGGSNPSSATNSTIKEKSYMKVLNLIIKQKYFDAILAGRKVQEFREVRPSTVKKYIELDEDGFEKEDEYGNAVPVKYDAIRFFVGYNADRDTALVEVVGAHTEIFVDENEQPIMYEHGKDKDGNPLVWVAEQVVYDLGKVLEHNIRDKSKNV